jgi:AraC-like DNA-binding protein
VASGRSRSETTLSIRLIWPFARLLSGDPRAGDILTRSGIRAEQFGNPDTRVSHRLAMRMLEETVRATGDPTVGLRAGAQLDSADIDVLEHAARTTANLGESILCMARYFRVMNEAAEIDLVESGATALWRFRIRDDVPQPPAANDFCIASALAFSERNAADYQPPVEIHLMHERPSHAAEEERAFRAPIRHGMPHNGLLLRRERLAVPMRRASPTVAHAFEHHARQLVAELEGRVGVAGRVREEVAAQLAVGSLSMALTAQRMAMSVATLRRRLEEEGATFSGIVDDLRKQLAERYLKDSQPTVSEIAFLLGFSDVAAFGRAFKRWRGVSPTEFRASSRN